MRFDARTGTEAWNYETMAWSYTVQPAHAGSPIVVSAGRKQRVYATFFNSDRRPVRNIEKSELFALDAEDGALLWKRLLTDHPVTSPTYFGDQGQGYLAVGSEDGCVYTVRAADGAPGWKRVLTHAVAATPAASSIAGQPVLYVGDRWGMLHCLSARTGSRIWGYKTGHEILSTPAIGMTKSNLGAFVGSSDRCIRAIDAKSSMEIWRFPTGKYVTASPVLCKVVGKPAVVCNSLDNKLYVLDAETGTSIWEMAAGDMLWAYETRGSTCWSSPAVAEVDGNPMIFYPAYDGKLYALKSVPRCFTDKEMPAIYAKQKRRGTAPPMFVLALGGLLVVAAVLLIFLSPRRALSGGRGEES